MTTIYLKPNDPSANEMRRIAFPDYTGNQFQVAVHEKSGMDLTSYWDGGSRSYYVVVRLADMTPIIIPENGSGFVANLRNEVQTALPAPGFAVVENQIFCGKRIGLTIHLHSENAVKFLPPQAELPWAEKVVLCATRSLKSSYAGISDYRLHESRATTGITPAEYASAKASLLDKKLLTKAGAITPDGKNAIGNLQNLYGLKRPA